jgi:hypothetical protein
MNYEEYIVRVYENGNIKWFNKDNKLHRVGGPAIEYFNGTKAYYIDDILHRVDGPAIESPNGEKEYYQYGKLHNLKGPAYVNSNGTCQYYINGVFYEENDFDKEVERIKNEELISQKQSDNNLDGKTVEIDGVKYRLEKIS